MILQGCLEFGRVVCVRWIVFGYAVIAPTEIIGVVEQLD